MYIISMIQVGPMFSYRIDCFYFCLTLFTCLFSYIVYVLNIVNIS